MLLVVFIRKPEKEQENKAFQISNKQWADQYYSGKETLRLGQQIMET